MELTELRELIELLASKNVSRIKTAELELEFHGGQPITSCVPSPPLECAPPPPTIPSAAEELQAIMKEME